MVTRVTAQLLKTRHFRRAAAGYRPTTDSRCVSARVVLRRGATSLCTLTPQVYAVAACLGAGVVATGGADDRARLWPIQGIAARALSGHTDSVAAVAFR